MISVVFLEQKTVYEMSISDRSSYVCTSDRIHGDLGMIQREDIDMCSSKSGNTPEIKVLVPLLKRRVSKLVALVSNTNSYLAQQADFVLNATISLGIASCRERVCKFE